MIVLAIDSSADTLAVAVLRDREPLADRARRAPRPRSEELLGLVDATLADAAVALDAVDLFAVATGPGSFNGIRGGIATAEGLALALDRPVVGVPTLDAIAYTHVGRAPVLLAALPAGRGDYYTASYEGAAESWRRSGAYSVGPLAGALEGLPPGVLVCGAVARDEEDLLRGRGLRRAPLFAELPRALAVGTLALEGASAGAYAPATPLYLRRPGITRPGKRAAIGERATRGAGEGEHGGHGEALSIRPGGGR